jgi:hypothetical protein
MNASCRRRGRQECVLYRGVIDEHSVTSEEGPTGEVEDETGAEDHRHGKPEGGASKGRQFESKFDGETYAAD